MQFRIETSEPLTFILSPFIMGEAKLRTPENVTVVRYHLVLSNVVLIARRDFSKPDRRSRHVTI